MTQPSKPRKSADVAALLAFAASVGVVISESDVERARTERQRSWRTGVNTSREQARRVRQRERAQRKRASSDD